MPSTCHPKPSTSTFTTTPTSSFSAAMQGQKRIRSIKPMDRYELRRQDYSLTDDHKALQDAYRQLLETHWSIDTVWAAQEPGFDKSLWERLCATGASSMAVGEDVGGDGATLVDLVLVA